MGIYLGYMEIKGYNTDAFYNFKPIYEIKGRSFVELSIYDIGNLLPDSSRGDINFYYDYKSTSQGDFMKEHFFNNQLIIFDFVTSDLQDNINSRGERNQTGYKVTARDMIQTKKVRTIDKEGFFFLIKASEIKSDFNSENIVEIQNFTLSIGMQVLLELDEDFYAGPYTVGYRAIDQAFYVRPQIRENKYIIDGYKKTDFYIQEIYVQDNFQTTQDKHWSIAVPQVDAQKVQRDVIDDAGLLESFRESLSNNSRDDGRLDLSNVEHLLEEYNNSALAGSRISKIIRTNRLNKLVELLTSESDVDNTFRLISEFICDLVIKYKNTPNTDELIRHIADTNPDFFEKVKSSRAIQDQIDARRRELDDLTEKRDIISNELIHLQEQAQSINKEAIKEKANEILAADEKYTQKKNELESILSKLNLAGEAASLQERYTHLKSDVDYLEAHEKRLESATKNTESQFVTLVNNFHDRLVEIAFDGFMANKMVKAAAQWEAEGVELSYEKSVEIASSIPSVEKEPEELINYLCQMVQIERPQYERNTIVNIAICMFQGFLTVFSGEPGSGKTSICALMAEVFGLNKLDKLVSTHQGIVDNLARYILVSVERGWTSKRDFAGYYNPLSKTFDKSNRRVYDALKILNIEQEQNINKFPFIILLDEANLSPMEYYWADFMSLCDDLSSNNQINLGEDNIFKIPSTLHFLATINNDHTTETLSPRLIDRAWIIVLPQFPTLKAGDKLSCEKIENISWESIKQTFLTNDISGMSPDIQKVYDNIILQLRKVHIVISPRTDLAIRRYWSVASKLFVKDEQYETEPSRVALDYAVAQKILPKISGNGDDFSNWLVEFQKLCSDNYLFQSDKIVRSIIERGKLQMKYYQFFG